MSQSYKQVKWRGPRDGQGIPIRNPNGKKPKRKKKRREWNTPVAVLGRPVEVRRPVNYEAYLQSPEWQKKREFALRIAEYRCRLCNVGNCMLHVHHRTYERLGDETGADLIVLCDECHTIFHKHGKLKK